MTNTDSDMPGLFDDSEYYIEDRTTRQTFHQWKAAGFWTGNTYVVALGDSLDVPPPPRSHTAQGPPGANPGPTATAASPISVNPMRLGGRDRLPGEEPPVPSPIHRPWTASATGRCRSTVRTCCGSMPSPRGTATATNHTGEALPSDHGHLTGNSPAAPRGSGTTIEVIARTCTNVPNAQAPTPSSMIRHQYNGSDAPRIVASPELCLAPRGCNGHPHAPDTVRRTDPDYVGSEDNVASDFDYVEREESRLAELRSRTPNLNETASATQLHDSRLGLFIYLQIANIAQALNLIAWLRVAQQETYEMFSLIVQNCSACPADFRSEGESYLLRNQQDIERTWWITVMGRPSGSAASSASVLSPIHGTTGTLCTTAEAGVTEHAYLGIAPQNPSDTGPVDPPGDFAEWTKLPNSIVLRAALLHHYTFLATAGWISGLCNMLHHLPTAANDTPLDDDVLAYHTILAMSPVNRRNIPHQFRRFFDTAIMMFLIPGLFDAILLVGGYPSAALPLTHYPFLTDNITMAHVASWFSQRGITAGAGDVRILESFSRARCNTKSNIADLENLEWLDALCTLEHASLAVPNSTNHPRIPAGLTDSQHAPMTGVEGLACNDGSETLQSESENPLDPMTTVDPAIGGASG
ncbi:hypothetical protein C8J57DRAFT_1237493 [Mycena rebaudengoi]|nr:hypothetical protein C8J57DRAFT_1237493 [Mycena rebaudengoi]